MALFYLKEVRLIKRRYGKPKEASRFICCKCLQENCVGRGIQRSHQREKFHIKDLTCINTGCDGKITKNIEVRYNDDYDEVFQKAIELHEYYYGNEVDGYAINIDFQKLSNELKN